MYHGEDCLGPMPAAVAERLADLTGRRVPIPVTPRGGEGLADIIYRAVAINGYRKVSELLGPGRFSHSTFAVNSRQLPGLADILGTPVGDQDLAPLRYARIPGELGRIDFFRASLPSRQLMARRRVSPRSLRESAHSKAIWHLTGLTFDPQNYELLVDRCPSCQTELNFIYTSGICHCHRCGPAVDLRNIQQPKISVTDKEALDFVTGLVDPERKGGKDAVSSLQPDLRDANAGHIFSLCILIAAAIDHQQRQSGRRFIAATAANPESLAAAGRAVLSWPEGLIDVLADQGTFKSATEKGEAHSFTTFCKHSGVLNVPLMSAVRNVVMLSRVGGTHPRWLRRLEVVKSGAVGNLPSELAHFAALSATGPFIKAVAAAKMPSLVLYDCYKNGLTGPLCERFEDIGPQIRDWSSRLSFGHVSTEFDLQSAVPLRNLVNIMFRKRGNVWPFVLEQLLKGSLPCKRSPTKGVGLDSLYITEFTTWRAFLANAPSMTDRADFPLNSPEVAFFLNMSLGAAQTLFDFKRMTTLNDLHAFSRKFIFCDNLSDLTAINGKRLTTEALHRQLTAAGIRMPGDRVVRRAESLQFLGLVHITQEEEDEPEELEFDVSRLRFKWSDVPASAR
ncbi:hypothetical protein ACQY74_002638 [Rhizobium leguminosarum bv. trifolii]